MDDSPSQIPGIYRHELIVTEGAVDQNGHVNNVVYVQWMQDAAINHSESVGGTRATRAASATWVIRSHHIEYLKPAFSGEELVVLTWVADIRRTSSLRRYDIMRRSDGELLARGETVWVFIDVASGHPLKIPESVRMLYSVVTERES